MSVGLFTNIVPPYRIPLFNRLASVDNIHLHVYLSDFTQSNRSWDTTSNNFEFEYTVAPGKTLHSEYADKSLGINLGAVRGIYENGHDVVIVGGYNQTMSWTAALLARVLDIPVVPWSGTWQESISMNNALISKIRRMYTNLGDAWIAYGTRSAQMLIEWDASSENVYKAINTVDVESIQASISRKPTPETERTLLYVGQLIPRKNVGSIINAMDRLSDLRINLSVVGDGPMRDQLENRAKSSGQNITFHGFVPRSKIFHYYLESDLLVLPSKEEVWGLVINEALACGVPVIVSSKCGCATDLVRDGFNGCIYNLEDTGDLSETLREAFQNRNKFAEPDAIMDDARNRFNIAESVAGFIRAINSVVSPDIR